MSDSSYKPLPLGRGVVRFNASSVPDALLDAHALLTDPDSERNAGVPADGVVPCKVWITKRNDGATTRVEVFFGPRRWRAKREGRSTE